MKATAIPQSVIKVAKHRLELGKSKIQLIAKWQQYDVYTVNYEETMTIGLPELYLWDGNSVRVVCGIEGEELLRKLDVIEENF